MNSSEKSFAMPQVPDTPMMQQYLQIKKEYKNEILFFRMGDFYEMFLDDAIYASKVLDIALTKRKDNIPMCGIPHHAMNNYVHQILRAGRDIAICDQIEDPATVSGRIVKRAVTRVLTPGSIFEEGLLESQETRKLAVILTAEKNTHKDMQGQNQFFVLVADVSGGDIIFSRQDTETLSGYLHSHYVKEVIYKNPETLHALQLDVERTYRRDYALEKMADSLKKMFATQNITTLEISKQEQTALYYLYAYIQEVAPVLKIRWKTPRKEEQSKMMILDHTALKTLEILADSNGNQEGSLLKILNFTATSAGKRQMSQMLSMPLLDINEINNRYDIVEFFMQEKILSQEIHSALKSCSDIERLLSSLENHPQVRHLGLLSETLEQSIVINNLLKSSNILPTFQQDWQTGIDDLAALQKHLQEALYLEDLPPLLDERRFVKKGYSEPLDELIQLNRSAQEVLHEFEENEKTRLGISTLRIKYNHVLGYFFEISKGMADKAPPEYNRRQTLVGAERFTTAELKDLENKLLNAKEQVVDIQRGIFLALVQEILQQTNPLRELAKQLAFTDVLLSFAQASKLYRYTRPQLCDNGDFIVQDGRHPVIEILFKEEVFVANDIHLNDDSRHLAILTGPNMSGKSTFIRQMGLIQIMAQAGCFVPARYARVSIADRVFTRIGAYDRLSKGESTFYVEMAECAAIFRHYTKRSLILLDEVGRGTSTFDGISIARAMIEQLNKTEANTNGKQTGKPRVLFATHYAELAEMISANQGIIGLTVSVVEKNNEVIFLRKIVEGKADKSYGIYVAKMAGLPNPLIERAQELLIELQEEGLWQTEPTLTPTVRKEKKNNDNLSQQSLF